MSDLRSRVLGTIFGTLSRGTFPQRNPVAWLYNGVRLPGLPVVEGFDKAKFTHKMIYFSNGSGDDVASYAFIAFSEPLYLNLDDNTLRWSATGEYIYFANFALADGSPGEMWSFTDGPYNKDDWWGNFGEHVIWTNYDICDTTGAVHLAGSEPVPVYE